MGRRKCPMCGFKWPLDSFWVKSKARKGGGVYTPHCRICRQVILSMVLYGRSD